MMKETLWGETEENGGEKIDRSRSPIMLERREASERAVEVRRRNSDEEMESDEEEEELDRDESDVLASIINTAVKSDGFFRHQQVRVLLRLLRIEKKERASKTISGCDLDWSNGQFLLTDHSQNF